MLKTYNYAKKPLTFKLWSYLLNTSLVLILGLSLTLSCNKGDELTPPTIEFKDAVSSMTKNMCTAILKCCSNNTLTQEQCEQKVSPIFTDKLAPLQKQIDDKKIIYHGNKFYEFIDSIKLISSKCNESYNNILFDQSFKANLNIDATCNPSSKVNECLNGYCKPATKKCAAALPTEELNCLADGGLSCIDYCYCHSTYDRCVAKHSRTAIGDACTNDNDCLKDYCIKSDCSKGSCINNICTNDICSLINP